MIDLFWLVSYLIVTVGLALFGLHRYFMLFLYYKYRNKAQNPLGYFDELPVVTIQIPIYNEMYVVERLIQSVAGLDYPKDKLEIQVLDDSTDESREIAAEQVKLIQAQGFDIKHIVRTNREGFKAGALALGLKQARGEFLAIFDADFMPTPNLLKETVHHFTNPKLGMIQTRWGHLNRHYSLLTRIQALFLDGHLLIEQTARNLSGRFFNFNGTAGIWRKTCIENAGGWEHDTLTEDLDLSYRAQIKGWKFIFLPHLVTPAELPVEMNAFKSQQHRWAKGSVQTCKKLLPTIWHSSYPFRIKLEATLHLTSNFAYLLLFAMCLLVNPSLAPQKALNWSEILYMHVPIFSLASLSVIVFYVCALKELHKKWWRELWCVPFLVAVGIGMSVNNAKAVLEAIFNHKTGFARTPKYGIQKPKENWQKKKYLAFKNYLPFIEIVMAIYFGQFVVRALRNEAYLSSVMPFLFFSGFLYVAVLSLFQHRHFQFLTFSKRESTV